MLTMGIEHYNQPHAVFFILEVSNAFFTTVFGLGMSNKTIEKIKYLLNMKLRRRKRKLCLNMWFLFYYIYLFFY